MLLDVRSVGSWIVVGLLGGAVACGRSSLLSRGDAAGIGEVRGDAVTSPDLGSDTLDASFRARYAGLVVAIRTREGATTSYTARAVFTDGQRPVIGGCPQCCCGSTDRGLPYPIKPPDAGKIALTAGGGAIATLDPAVFEGGSGRFYGMSDLGWSWSRPLGDYGPVECQPWSTGDVLHVLATGNEVESFSEDLRTGPPLTGVVPSIGPSPVVVDHGQQFTISWSPQNRRDATMLLTLPYAGGICFCDAPDWAGQLVVDANLLSPISAEKNGKIKLSRLTITTVASGNSSLDLVGAEVQAGPLTIE